MKELLTLSGEHHEVVDEEGLVMMMERIPSPKPRMNSRLALPMKNRWWRRLRIVKHDKTSYLIFFLGETKFIE